MFIFHFPLIALLLTLITHEISLAAPQLATIHMMHSDTNSSTFKNVTYKEIELVNYGDELIEALEFVQTKKLAGDANAAKIKVESMLAKHHSHDEMYLYLLELSQDYPEITRLYSIGESVQGKKLWVLEITEEPGKHKLRKPEFRYIANMRGNHVIGRELLLHLARLLCENYRAAQEEPVENREPTPGKFVRKLLKETRIHLMPSMNPDGYSKCKVGTNSFDDDKCQYNANNIDLSRNFPDPVRTVTKNPIIQPEVRAVMEWSKSVPFVLSANLYDGALVVNYPYDRLPDGSMKSDYSATPDDDTFQRLSEVYSYSHPHMSAGKPCEPGECGFKYGITNGADWYPVYGGMPDWLYGNTNALHLGIGLSCDEYPPENTLPQYWKNNKRALLNFIKAVHWGIKGTVRDSVTGDLLPNVTVKLPSFDTHGVLWKRNVTSTIYGDYFRIVKPGFFNFVWELENYKSNTDSIFTTYTKPIEIVDIKLEPVLVGAPATASSNFVPSSTTIGDDVVTPTVDLS